MSEKKQRVLVCQFPGGGSTHIQPTLWVAETILKLDRDSRVGPGNYQLWQNGDTPITMNRNQAFVVAENGGFDWVVMIDSDIRPDLYIGPGGKAQRPGAVPFWETSWEFALRHEGPCVVAAPYCGPPPFENPYQFHWTNTQTDDPNANFQIAGYSRNEASTLQGILPAAALPTGLILISMEGVRRVPHPRCDYEWKDDGAACRSCGQRRPGPRVEKASTEDVYLTRNLSYAGVPQYCAWSSWAAHRKIKEVGAPQPIPPEIIPHWFELKVLEKYGIKPAPVTEPGPPAIRVPYVERQLPPVEVACPNPPPDLPNGLPRQLEFKAIAGEPGRMAILDAATGQPASTEQLWEWWAVHAPMTKEAQTISDPVTISPPLLPVANGKTKPKKRNRAKKAKPPRA